MDFGAAPFAWIPSAEQIAQSRLASFMRAHGIEEYQDLIRRSVDDPEWFWPAVFAEIGIEFTTPYTQLIDRSAGIAWPRWCVGGGLNIVDCCLEKWMHTPVESRVAVRWEGEEGAVRTLTYRQLCDHVEQCARGLRALGVAKGDRVALFMSMCPETVVAFFATIKIGALVLPLFSGYGCEAVASRLRDAAARVLITTDGFWRRGQIVEMKPVADEAVQSADSVQHIVVVPRLGHQVAMRAGRDVTWAEMMGKGKAAAGTDGATQPTSTEDPLMIIYTSGTTGRPKGALHLHCGFPIKAAQDMAHAFDVRDSDTMYWVTDIGWMMGPWELFGMTLLGGTIVIYDGALDYPAPDRLWSLVERHQVTVLGVSPTLIRALMRHGDDSARRHDLSSLRILGSTGEPWNPESWRWFFDIAGSGRLPIINYSGGTEVSGGLLAGNVITPIKPAAFAGPPPGIAVDVVDESGHSVRGRVGELVVRAPWIGMTHGFWNDAERYLDTYWSRFPDTWVHGDWAAVDDDGQWYIFGRSDDTIKIAGKRLGPAEVESVLVEHPAVIEAAAIGVPDAEKGQSLVCFCVLRPGYDASPELVQALRAQVGTRLGKPMRPQIVSIVKELPKTRNGKVMRRVIRAAYLGESAGDLSALENPQALAQFAGSAKRPSDRGTNE